MSRASTHEISVESSAYKHSYETVDEPILIMHTMTCIIPAPESCGEFLTSDSNCSSMFSDYSDPLPYDFGIPYLYRCSATVARS